jgi:alkylation response protein AidB-like acyl-CoA dehydrogenase
MNTTKFPIGEDLSADRMDRRSDMIHGSDSSSITAASTLVARARALGPFFEARAQANEDAGVLTDEVVAAVERAGFFGLWVPRSLGGSEHDAVQGLEVIEELSRADASLGWVVMAAALAIATGAAYLEDAAVAQLFPGDRLPVIAGQGSFPHGKAVARQDGYVLSGTWSYGSGVRHAGYLHSAAIVHDEGGVRLDAGGAPEVRIFVTPQDQAVLGDNWDVLGLRATASIDYAIEATFVPRAFTHAVHTEEPRRGGSLFRLGIPGLAALCHSGWALGVGRRALDELVAYAHTRANRAGALAQSESFFEALGRAEAGYRAARALVSETWEGNQATLDRGDRLSTRQRTMSWLALNHTTWSVAETCRFAYTAAGGTSLRRGPLQRLFRDVHAGTQHATSAASVLRDCGRELSGFAADQAWHGSGLAHGAGGASPR